MTVNTIAPGPTSAGPLLGRSELFLVDSFPIREMWPFRRQDSDVPLPATHARSARP